jgi:hypothetical protein
MQLLPLRRCSWQFTTAEGVCVLLLLLLLPGEGQAGALGCGGQRHREGGTQRVSGRQASAAAGTLPVWCRRQAKTTADHSASAASYAERATGSMASLW